MSDEKIENPLDTMPRFEFWQDGLAAMARNACDLLLLAGEPVNHRTIMAVVKTAPTCPWQVDDKHWQLTSFCYDCLMNAWERYRGNNRRLGEIAGYFFRRFVNHSPVAQEILVDSIVAILTEINAAMVLEPGKSNGNDREL